MGSEQKKEKPKYARLGTGDILLANRLYSWRLNGDTHFEELIRRLRGKEIPAIDLQVLGLVTPRLQLEIFTSIQMGLFLVDTQRGDEVVLINVMRTNNKAIIQQLHQKCGQDEYNVYVLATDWLEAHRLLNEHATPI